MRKFRSWLVVGSTVIALLGCNSSAKKRDPSTPSKIPAANTAPTAEITNTDACAMRLHELCGPLLFFYGTHHRLPNNLKELSDEMDVGDLTCPVSHQPYVYDPEGKQGTDPKMRIVIYDATPAHSGIRWGIGLIEAAPGTAPVAKVVAVPNQVIPMQMK
jgi:hypothetical protein